MDLSDPTRAVTPTLDGPVLAVLAAAGSPLTVAEVAAQAVRGSEIGVRRSLARLVDQGVVRTTTVGRTQVHELNREHVAAGVAEALAGLRLELWRRLRDTLAGWDPAPLYAVAFGSAARGDGGGGSDIDLLLVHADRDAAPVRDQWHAQVDDLRRQVRLWTGNSLQVVEMSLADSSQRRSHRLLDEVDRDGVELVPWRRGRRRG